MDGDYDADGDITRERAAVEEDDRVAAGRHVYGGDSLLVALSRQWRGAPWYVSSLFIHMVIFALLLLFAPAPKPPAKRRIQVTTDMITKEELPPQYDPLTEPEPEPEPEPAQTDLVNPEVVIDTTFDISPELDITQDEEVPIDPTDFADADSENEAPMVMGLLGPTGGGSTFGNFGNRDPRKRKGVLRKYGGDEQTESAVRRGLAYLARHQDADGSWKLFHNEKYFSGRFGFPKEPHLPVHNDGRGQRREFCTSPVRIPYDMTLALELDHVDDHLYVYINDTRHGPYPDGGDHGDGNWSGSFQVRKGDTLRAEVISTQVGSIWAVGRYYDSRHPAPAKMERAPYFRTEAGLTALCTLAFLGEGNTARTGKYRNTVRKAQEFLLRFSYTEFGTSLPAPVAFEAPIVIMALAELYGMDGDSRVKRRAQELVGMGLKYQLANSGWPENMANDKVGGWHNTTWWISAMRSAQLAGLSVPRQIFDKTLRNMMDCVKYEGANDRYANIQFREGYPRNDGGSISKMVSSMAVFLMNSLYGTGVEDAKIKAMCELMVLAGTNRNGVWDWPGGNLGFEYQGKLTYLPEFFEAADAESTASRLAGESGKGYLNYYLRSVQGFPDGLWGKPGYVERFAELARGGQLKPVNRWYSATYWYWQGYSFSRLGHDSAYWRAWNNNFKPYLLYTQARGDTWSPLLTADSAIAGRLESGDIDGSWPGVFLKDGCGPFEDMGAFGATAFCCMMLEVYYRY